MKKVTRFAPSPTGYLHVGNLRTALISWLYAQSVSGKFILRIDDTDLLRSKQEYVEAIKNDLSWVGIKWDEIFFQSSRIEKYKAAMKKLIADKRLYPCYETEQELSLKRKSLLMRNLPPIYDRQSLHLKEEDKQAMEEKGIKPHWRFLLKDEKISWNDKVRGEINFSSNKLSDPVLIRADGTFTYSLASVVDDIEMDITDIIRGEDHISNSAIHIQIFNALDAQAPDFSHISLLINKNKVLSKRDNESGVRFLKEKGVFPKALLIFLSKLGSSDSVQENLEMNDLIKDFSFTKLSKSAVQYDEEDLLLFNSKVLRTLNFEDIKRYLSDKEMKYMTSEFWELIRGNISSIEEIQKWLSVCYEDVVTKITDDELVRIAAQSTPVGKFTDSTWPAWLEEIKRQTDKRGKNLFVPMRLVLTGEVDGPELSKLLPFIDRDLVIKRLNAY